MMHCILQFQLNDVDTINFYLYEDVNDLYYWDSELKITFKDNHKEIVLFNDYIIEGIGTLNNVLTSLLNNTMNIEQRFLNKGFGHYFNKELHKTVTTEEYHEEDPSSSYSLWEAKGWGTWVYNLDSEIYFEISPIYKWHFSEGDNDREYIPFDKFIDGYKIYKNLIIDKTKAQEWLEKCEKIFENMKK